MKEGAKIFQMLLPVSLHQKLSEICFRSKMSKSQIGREAIEVFLKNFPYKCEDTKNADN